MTLVSQLITDAYRSANLININTSPTSAESTEALRLLNRIINELFGNEVGQPYEEVPVGRGSTRYAVLPSVNFAEDYSGYYIPENVRLSCTLTAATSVILPPNPQNGARFAVIDLPGNLATYNLTVNGNGRNIEGAATLTLSTNSLNREWLYRADTGNWARLADLATSDPSPFPSRHDTFIILSLAQRLMPANDQGMSAEMVDTFRRVRSKFLADYSMKTFTPSEDGLSRTVLNPSGYDINFARGY